MGISIDGLDAFEQRLVEITQRYPEKRDKFLRQEGELIVGRAKNNTPVDQGTLRAGWKRTNPMGGTMDVYNNTEYAAHVEWGHRQKKRWVPGHWNGNHFVYEPGAKTGMMLKERVVSGAKMLHRAIDETRLNIRGDARRILGELFQ